MSVSTSSAHCATDTLCGRSRLHGAVTIREYVFLLSNLENERV
jgi:hypothetical protein